MSDYQWCHGPSCHKRHTTTRVRGVKGSKVLRTRKIPYNSHYENYYTPYKYFCDQTCLMDFIREHIQEFVDLHPRTECLETPIDIVEETRTDWRDNPYKVKVIKEVVDNA
tara:strand:+ start:167 stop:496 length:330 start_codon:yes stop_codon:yes gene_type:complete